MLLKFNIEPGYLHLYFFMVHKKVMNFAAMTATHLYQNTLESAHIQEVFACQMPGSSPKEGADERLGGCYLGLRNCFFSANDLVVMK